MQQCLESINLLEKTTTHAALEENIRECVNFIMLSTDYMKTRLKTFHSTLVQHEEFGQPCIMISQTEETN